MLPTPLRKVIVVAPHPDDETIGAFGLMRHMIRRGAAVGVTLVTDGSASHPNSRAWPPARLARTRRRETLAAVRLAGLFAGSVRFLNYPDGTLPELDASGLRLLSARLAAGPQPDLVIRPSLCDTHPDHRIVAETSRLAWPPVVPQITYQVWPEGRCPPGGRPFRLGPDLPVKRSALRLYRTQTGLITDDPTGFCMDRDLLRSFSGPAEWYGHGP